MIASHDDTIKESTIWKKTACEHPFAGQNTQHMKKPTNLDGVKNITGVQISVKDIFV